MTAPPSSPRAISNMTNCQERRKSKIHRRIRRKDVEKNATKTKTNKKRRHKNVEYPKRRAMK